MSVVTDRFPLSQLSSTQEALNDSDCINWVCSFRIIKGDPNSESAPDEIFCENGKNNGVWEGDSLFLV